MGDGRTDHFSAVCLRQTATEEPDTVREFILNSWKTILLIRTELHERRDDYFLKRSELHPNCKQFYKGDLPLNVYTKDLCGSWNECNEENGQ